MALERFAEASVNYLEIRDCVRASSALSSLYNFNPKFEIRFEKLDTPISVAIWKTYHKELSTLILNSDIPDERLRFFCTRLVMSANLFSAFHSSAFFRTGVVNINLNDTPAAPGLAFCSNSETHTLIPDFIYLSSKGYADLANTILDQYIAFEDREPIAYWRGNSACRREGSHWRTMPRIRLCELATNKSHAALFDVGLSDIAQVTDAEKIEIIDAGFLKGFAPLESFLKCQYHIDIDGNSNSWPGLFQKLLLGGTIIKVSSALNFRQWYYDRLIPWQNYVPVETQMGDLVEKVIWLNKNQEKAREIAIKAQMLGAELTYVGEVQMAVKAVHEAMLMHEYK